MFAWSLTRWCGMDRWLLAVVKILCLETFWRTPTLRGSLVQSVHEDTELAIPQAKIVASWKIWSYLIRCSIWSRRCRLRYDKRIVRRKRRLRSHPHNSPLVQTDPPAALGHSQSCYSTSFRLVPALGEGNQWTHGMFTNNFQSGKIVCTVLRPAHEREEALSFEGA